MYRRSGKTQLSSRNMGEEEGCLDNRNGQKESGGVSFVDLQRGQRKEARMSVQGGEAGWSEGMSSSFGMVMTMFVWIDRTKG